MNALAEATVDTDSTVHVQRNTPLACPVRGRPRNRRRCAPTVLTGRPNGAHRPFEPRSRRPKTSPSAISDDAAGLIIGLRKDLAGQGLDAGPQTIAWHLQQYHQVNVSAATVSRYPNRAGLVTPAPARRPESSYIRFEADMPNERWQSDFTRYPLASGTDTEILTWLDDHSRYALSVTAHDRVTGPAVLLAFRAACDRHGVPASTLTDNGMVFTTRLSGGKGGRNALEHELRRLGITQKNGKPNHPPLTGQSLPGEGLDLQILVTSWHREILGVSS